MDAAIWTEQQLVAIPGWLCEDKKARLRTRQKEELFTAGEGVQDGNPSLSPPPPTPVATFGLRPASFQKSTRIWKVAGGISKIAYGF